MTQVNWISLKMPQEIKEALQKRNQTHFGQAHGSIPTVPPFSEWVNWQASTYQADLILNNIFHQDELDELSTSLLHHMKKHTDLDTIWSKITIDEWKNKIKVWKESTSTSPSGFHLTHSHALIAPHDIPPDHNDYDALETQHQELIVWQVHTLNTALTNAYSFRRWQHIANIMLLKEPGNYQINHLRVIHIYKHNYNLILALKWRALIQHSVQNNLIHPSQYGGNPGRTSVQPMLIKEFQNEICHASRRPLVHLNYDAASCYDRITLNMASIISRSFRLHRNITTINVTTLQKAKNMLKTQLGMPQCSYTHTPECPLYGIAKAWAIHQQSGHC